MKLVSNVQRDTEPPQHQSCCMICCSALDMLDTRHAQGAATAAAAAQTDDVDTEETPPLAFIFPHLVIVTSPAARA